MRDLTAQMEMVSRAEFKNPLETILYANGTKVLGREILRLVIHCSRHEASVWVSCYVGKLQPLNEEG
ncbi:MAG TPA: hypothetical protein DEQ40_06425 [Oxalobacteraceae bacterium]|nr:hypothetical protein [Oxalobacteraceae bacterium]